MLGSAFLSLDENKEESTDDNPVLRPIPTSVVKSFCNNDTRIFPGEVRANRRVKLAFSVSGLLDQLNAREGSTLHKGEILARLDERDFRYAFEIAQAKLDQAERNYERCKNLLEDLVITNVEYDDSKTRYEIALAQLRTYKKALEDTQLIAPFDGIVVKRYIENHEHIKVHEEIVSFQDISVVEVVTQFPESLIARKGMDELNHLNVCFDTDHERWLNASIKEYSAQSDPITKTYDVVVSLKPPSDLMVLPGMTTWVKMNLEGLNRKSNSENQMTQIPVEAVWRDGEGRNCAWVIDKNGGFPHKRQIEVQDLFASFAHVSSGLHCGEHVAIAGLHLLGDQQPVRPAIFGKEGLYQ